MILPFRAYIISAEALCEKSSNGFNLIQGVLHSNAGVILEGGDKAECVQIILQQNLKSEVGL